MDRANTMDRPCLNLSSTRQVLNQSSLSFISNFRTFLLLSLLLFSFKTTVEHGTLHFTTFLQHQKPFFQSLFSPHPSPPKPLSDHPENPKLIGNGQSLLLFTGAGILNSSLFPDHSDLYGHITLMGNSSYVTLIHFNNITVVKSGSFEMVKRISYLEDSRISDRTISKSNGQELVLNRANVCKLLLLFFGVSAVLGSLFLGFVGLYCCVLGVVCFSVISILMVRGSSLVGSIRAGCRLGIRRLKMFVLLKWTIREILTQFLSICFFSGITNPNTLVHLNRRLKLMAYSVNSSWIQEMSLGREVHVRTCGFLFTWFFLDIFLSLFTTVDCWVAIMDTRRSFEGSVTEGCRLMYTMFHQAIMIKGLESIFAGLMISQFVARGFGYTVATFFQSVVETYFLVVWLRFYFAARSKTQRFGLRDLEEFLERNG